MGKFIYRLQNVLNIKEKLETKEKQAFALCMAKLSEEEAVLEEMYVQKKNIEDETRALLSDTLDILKLKECEAKLNFKKQEIKKQILNVETAKKNLEMQRIRMQKAIQERKTYEKLREKAFEDFLHEENAKEIKEIDELTSYVYGKKTKE